MASTWSNLKIELIGTGEQSGTWGTTTNTNLGTAIEQALVGYGTASFTSDANLTLGYTDSNASQTFRNLVLNATSTGSLTATRDLIVPTTAKLYYVFNNTTGGQSIVVKTSAGTGITIPNGSKAAVYCDGTNVVPVFNSLPVSATLTYKLPTTDGTNGQVLQTNGSGTLSFVSGASLATPLAVTGNATAGAEIRLPEDTDNGSNYVAIKAPDSIASNATLTAPAVTDTIATIGTAQTFTAAQTFRATNAIRSEAANTQDAIVIAGRAGGTSSYAATITPPTLAANITLTLPAATGTLLTSTSPLAVAGNSSEGASIRLPEDTDNGTNYVAIKAPDSLAADYTCTLPDETCTLGFRNIPQNSKSDAYTLVLADSGKHILHPSADTTARTFTIPANSSVAFPIGTAITFVNQNGAGSVTIAITADTMRLAGAGTTGSRTLAANGVATCIKLTSTEWIISGTGLT